MLLQAKHSIFANNMECFFVSDNMQSLMQSTSNGYKKTAGNITTLLVALPMSLKAKATKLELSAYLQEIFKAV